MWRELRSTSSDSPGSQCSGGTMPLLRIGLAVFVAAGAASAGVFGPLALYHNPQSDVFYDSGTVGWVDEDPLTSGPSDATIEIVKREGSIRCSFWLSSQSGSIYNYGWDARLVDPAENQIGESWGSRTANSGASSVTGYLPDEPTYGQYKCVVGWMVNGWDVGVFEYRFNVDEPAAYAKVGEGNGSGTPAPCVGRTLHYWKTRDYQVQTSSGNAISRVMPISEQLTTGGSTCAGSPPNFVEGGGSTTSAGRWRDNIYYCGIFTCEIGGSCELHRYQIWTAETTRTLSPNPMHITYNCSAPAFSPW